MMMRKILLKTSEIESVWEEGKVCHVRTTSGKIWHCLEQITDLQLSDVMSKPIRTFDYIEQHKSDDFVLLYLNVEN